MALAAPAFVDLSPTLDGRLVRIEPLAARHEEGLREAAADPRTWRWMPFVPTADAESFHGWMTDALAKSAEGIEAPFCVLDAGSGRPLGSTPLPGASARASRASRSAGRGSRRAAWGTGANAEAKLLLLSTPSSGWAACGSSSRPTP